MRSGQRFTHLHAIRSRATYLLRITIHIVHFRFCPALLASEDERLHHVVDNAMYICMHFEGRCIAVQALHSMSICETGSSIAFEHLRCRIQVIGFVMISALQNSVLANVHCPFFGHCPRFRHGCYEKWGKLDFSGFHVTSSLLAFLNAHSRCRCRSSI